MVREGQCDSCSYVDRQIEVGPDNGSLQEHLAPWPHRTITALSTIGAGYRKVDELIL